VIDRKRLLPRFLNYFLNWDFAQGELKKLASRAVGQANINATKLSGFTIPVPAIDEQREIVAILDAIDRKIDLHRQKRAVLDELFKALLHKLMAGEIRVADLDLSALVEPGAPTAPNSHSGESRNPSISRSGSGKMGPGFRRDDSDVEEAAE
jgi:hypothetical protein